MRWRGAFVIGGWTGVADGDDLRVVTSQAFVDGVVAALESGTDGGACARRGPTAARTSQAIALRAGFGSAADSTEQYRADGEGAVTTSNAEVRRRCNRAVVGVGE